MVAIDAETASEAWVKAAKKIQDLELVSEVECRAGATLELLHVGFTIKSPRERWVNSRLPPLNPAFALAEVVWIVNGSNDARIINHWNPALPRFSGKTDHYHGAYGFRLRRQFGFDQLERAYQALRNNKNSRQVVLQIWDPKADFPFENGDPIAPDIPCNICSFLKVREEKLEWTQLMRSNDLFRGLPYNFVQFTTLQEIIAGWLGIGIGTYNHFSDSLHLYKSDLNTVQIDNSKNKIRNLDYLSVPRKESIHYFQILFEKMQKMVIGNIEDQSFMRLFEPGLNNEAFQNILLVLGADIAERKNLTTLSEELIGKCTNALYSEMWNKWLKRKS